MERVLVSEIPGTTRDAIDSWLVKAPDPQAIKRAEAALQVAKETLAAALEAEEERLEADEANRVAAVTYIPYSEELEPTVDMQESAWTPPVEDLDDLVAEALRAEEALKNTRRDRHYMVIDTAGIRRRKWVRTHVEKLSIVKSFKAVDRAEVCVLLLDANEGVTDQDAKLAGLIQDKGRACVLLVNKWDAVADKDTYTVGRHVLEIREALKFCRYAPILFISALSGQRVHKILDEVDRVRERHRKRISTGELNRWLLELTGMARTIIARTYLP